MAIDIKKAKEAFEQYISKYNPEDEKVKLKINHIQRVSRIAKKIAQSIDLNNEDVELAELIGLLHDIGRFEQINKYHTFVDKLSINHGEYGVKVLFEDGLIRNFIQDNSYDKIIKTSIINHNRAQIEPNLTKREILHSKIIRDADKTDIFYVLTTGDKKAIWESYDLSNDIISDEIYREFIEDKKINYKNRNSNADTLVCHFAYVFDFNFKGGLENIYENNYIEKLYNRFKFKDSKTQGRYEKIYEISKQYVYNKLKKEGITNV